jgi:N-acetylglucosamine-6-phosphate deacetylase
VQAIVDHVHLAPQPAYASFLATRGRFCLVSDPMEGAGLEPHGSPPGHDADPGRGRIGAER